MRTTVQVSPELIAQMFTLGHETRARVVEGIAPDMRLIEVTMPCTPQVDALGYPYRVVEFTFESDGHRDPDPQVIVMETID